jgi:hypothetical protein
MTEFLLAGTRQPQPGGLRELALAAAARRVVQAAAWYGWMRRPMPPIRRTHRPGTTTAGRPGPG